MWDTLAHRWFRLPYLLHSKTIRPLNARQSHTILFIHGLGASGKMWRKIEDHLSSNNKLITIDLLGFGDSVKPKWATYKVSAQARSITATLAKNGTMLPPIIVGHSLGALVAIELARRHPHRIKHVVLCSPPLYKIDKDIRRSVPNADTMLRTLFQAVRNQQNSFLKMANLAIKLRLLDPNVTINNENAYSYMETLGASIINQTSMSDAINLKCQITIVHGALDPLVLLPNLKKVVTHAKSATLKVIPASHDIRGRYIKHVVTAVESAIESIDNNRTM